MDNFITADQIMRVLTYDALIDTMAKALTTFSSESVVQPVRTVMPVKKEGGFFGLMPCSCDDEEILGAKIVTFFPHNSTRYNLPTHHGIILLLDPRTGIPSTIMDGEVITSMRTAAVSAVATKYLAREGSTKLAILGSGVQARSHYEAIKHVMDVQQVTIWSRTFENASKCAAAIGGMACHTAEEAVKDADVIVTVTMATMPVLQKEWVKQGAHINAVGACRYDWMELDPALTSSSILYVDSREAAMKESGDIIISKAEIYAELGEMIQGQKEARRNETTVFKSLGLAIEDTMSAQLVKRLLSNEESSITNKV